MYVPYSSFLALLLVLATGCSHPHKNPFLQGLPLREFEQSGPMVVYNKNNLFDYINGEAAVYLPLGFDLLYTCTYQKKEGGALIIADVYEMNTPDGARAVLKRFSQEGGGQIQNLGDSGWRDNSVVLFQRDRYYLKLFSDPSPDNEVKATLQDMLNLSRALDVLVREH